MKRKLELLCDSNPMCYGSSAALLAILDDLDARRTAIAGGITAEILGRDPSIDALITVEPKDPVAVNAAIGDRTFDAVLVVANQSNIDVYHRRGIPIFFVDILYWMGKSKAQDVWRLAEQTFVENFPGVRERLARGETPGAPIVVGPLIRSRQVILNEERTSVSVLVNLGGARSRFIRPGIDSPYPRLVMRWLAALEPFLPDGRILVASGEEAIAAASAERQPNTGRVELRSLPQPTFLRALDSARLYITIPGLNSVFEGLASRKPMLFLPPQNATQVLQLARYEQHGLVARGLNLGALDPAFPEDPDRLDEPSLTAEVLASLRRLDQDAMITDRVVEHLRAQVGTTAVDSAAREAFSHLLGAPGGPAVAESVKRWWEDRC